MPYGVANRTGKPDQAVAVQIVAASWARGVRFFDTAQAYGDSEWVLGAALQALGVGEQAKVISKLGPAVDSSNARALRKAVCDSMERMKIDSLWGFLLHREQQLDDWNGPLGATLQALKQEGLIRHLGVSVYAPGRALQALEMPAVDAIQVPANVFDRRVARAGVFRRAGDLGKKVFIRSVFLQGLALMSPSVLPGRLSFARKALESFVSFCDCRKIDARQFAIDYVRSIAPAAVQVIGAETPAQAEENFSCAAQAVSSPDSLDEWNRLWPDDDPQLVDPSKWPLPGN